MTPPEDYINREEEELPEYRENRIESATQRFIREHPRCLQGIVEAMDSHGTGRIYLLRIKVGEKAPAIGGERCIVDVHCAESYEHESVVKFPGRRPIGPLEVCINDLVAVDGPWNRIGGNLSYSRAYELANLTTGCVYSVAPEERPMTG